MKKKKCVLIITTTVAALLLTAFLVFGHVLCVALDTNDPVSAAAGYLLITCTPADYAEIQRSPKVVITKSSAESITAYIEHLEGCGFVKVEEESRYSVYVYSNGEETIRWACEPYLTGDIAMLTYLD